MDTVISNSNNHHEESRVVGRGRGGGHFKWCWSGQPSEEVIFELR